ncbi:MAG TPA: hypothetical protein QF480_07575 [Bacteroidales bacterium]|jgi:hypothetical protein|nr:hypothetical protein [Bacteroidales bacterium]|tara:strand:+ start:495 stop:1109 length:615 start_codon:yes stop_codon:yes gene_type:complete
MNPRTTTKNMILVICSLRNHANYLLNNGKEYQDLLNYLFSLDFFWDEDKPYPAVKDICAATGLTNGKLKRLTGLIFKDLITENDDLKLKIDKVEYVFTLSYFDRYISFSVDNLPQLPRIGESFEVPYFYQYIGCRMFHVESIYHDFYDCTQYITIRLKSGSYNKYWHIRKDEAECKREVSLHDLYKIDDWDLQKKLGVIPKGLY